MYYRIIRYRHVFTHVKKLRGYLDEGFVFIELLAALFTLSILAAVAVPAYTDYVLRAQTAEGFVLAIPAQKAVGDYYAYHGRFPADNREANLPEPEQLKGAYVSRLDVLEGSIQVTFRGDLTGKVLSFQAQANVNNPLGTISWRCGQDERTTLEPKYLPSPCK